MRPKGYTEAELPLVCCAHCKFMVMHPRRDFPSQHCSHIPYKLYSFDNLVSPYGKCDNFTEKPPIPNARPDLSLPCQ